MQTHRIGAYAKQTKCAYNDFLGIECMR